MSDDYMPRTSVSFAATEPFARRWKEEAKEQMQKFTQSTWQQDVVEEEEQPAAPTPAPPQPQPTPIDDDRRTIIAYGVLGALFLVTVAGIAYAIYKCRQN